MSTASQSFQSKELGMNRVTRYIWVERRSLLDVKTGPGYRPSLLY